jgi:type IV pilus assembly protein PilA
MLARLRKAQEENEGGFTLIELLVVVIIIGILAAIAIPTFLNQREKAWEKQALSDLRNGSVMMEEVFSNTGDYPTANPGFKLSEGVTFSKITNPTASTYCLEVKHTSLENAAGTDKEFKLDSTVGRPVAGVC